MLPEELHTHTQFLPGFVYLMKDSKGRFKIGHSSNPRKRRAQLSSLKHPVKLFMLITTSNMIAIELELHYRFKGKRISDEWYRLSKTDIEIIVREYGGAFYEGGRDPSVP